MGETLSKNKVFASGLPIFLSFWKMIVLGETLSTLQGFENIFKIALVTSF